MAKRDEHRFLYSAERLARAAADCASWHRDKAEQHRKACEVLKQLTDVDVNCALGMAHTAMRGFLETADKFELAQRMYASQPPKRNFELDADDVRCLRLCDGPRENWK